MLRFEKSFFTYLHARKSRLLYPSDAVNPFSMVRDIDVHTGSVRRRAFVSVGYDAYEYSVDDERSAAVALTSVRARVLVTSAELSLLYAEYATPPSADDGNHRHR